MGGVGCAGYVVQVAQAMWWPVQTNNIARLGLSQVSQSEPSVAINIGGTVQQAMLHVQQAMLQCTAGYAKVQSDNHATSWPNLQDESFKFFS